MSMPNKIIEQAGVCRDGAELGFEFDVSGLGNSCLIRTDLRRLLLAGLMPDSGISKQEVLAHMRQLLSLSDKVTDKKFFGGASPEVALANANALLNAYENMQSTEDLEDFLSGSKYFASRNRESGSLETHFDMLIACQRQCMKNYFSSDKFVNLCFASEMYIEGSWKNAEGKEVAAPSDTADKKDYTYHPSLQEEVVSSCNFGMTIDNQYMQMFYANAEFPANLKNLSFNSINARQDLEALQFLDNKIAAIKTTVDEEEINSISSCLKKTYDNLIVFYRGGNDGGHYTLLVSPEGMRSLANSQNNSDTISASDSKKEKIGQLAKALDGLKTLLNAYKVLLVAQTDDSAEEKLAGMIPDVVRLILNSIERFDQDRVIARDDALKQYFGDVKEAYKDILLQYLSETTDASPLHIVLDKDRLKKVGDARLASPIESEMVQCCSQMAGYAKEQLNIYCEDVLPKFLSDRKERLARSVDTDLEKDMELAIAASAAEEADKALATKSTPARATLNRAVPKEMPKRAIFTPPGSTLTVVPPLVHSDPAKTGGPFQIKISPVDAAAPGLVPDSKSTPPLANKTNKTNTCLLSVTESSAAGAQGFIADAEKFLKATNQGYTFIEANLLVPGGSSGQFYKDEEARKVLLPDPANNSSTIHVGTLFAPKVLAERGLRPKEGEAFTGGIEINPQHPEEGLKALLFVAEGMIQKAISAADQAALDGSAIRKVFVCDVPAGLEANDKNVVAFLNAYGTVVTDNAKPIPIRAESQFLEKMQEFLGGAANQSNNLLKSGIWDRVQLAFTQANSPHLASTVHAMAKTRGP